MNELGGFDMEAIINVRTSKEGGEMQELRVEQLTAKFRRLQQGKRLLAEEIEEISSTHDTLEEELSALQAEAYQQEEMYKEKEELFRKLQLQCEESEQDSVKQLKQNKTSEELVEKYKCEIQELKLKHRKQRMRFENQLQQLIEEHKKLHSVFAPERLPDELESAESTKSQLLAAEQVKLAQLHKLDEELENVKKAQQLDITTTQTSEE